MLSDLLKIGWIKPIIPNSNKKYCSIIQMNSTFKKSSQNHTCKFYFTNRLTWSHVPPFTTLVNPFCSSIDFACELLPPLRQNTTMFFLFLNFASCEGTLSSGILTEPFTCPSANSIGVLTSTRKAPSSIMTFKSAAEPWLNCRTTRTLRNNNGSAKWTR